jgi:hypothetical protein
MPKPPTTSRKSAAPSNKEMGRPAHRPAYVATDQHRSQVAAMVVADIDQAMIAACLRISAVTLRKHYRRELNTSYAIIKADISAKAVTLARAGSERMIMFFLETRGGWVRSERLVVADGGIDDTDVSKLSDADLEARAAYLRGRIGKRR